MTPAKFEERIIRIEEKVDNLISIVSELRTSVFAFAKFQNEVTGIEKYKEKQSFNARQRAAIYVSGIIGVSGIICSIILKLF